MLPFRTDRACLAGARVFASLVLASACGGGSTGASAGRDGGSPNSPDTSTEGASTPPHDGGAPSDSQAPSEAASACVPAIPHLAWTSPYAGWSSGISSDPSFFPIAVWLQQSFHAMELSGLGVNIYVGNNAGVDPLMASDLATLKSYGMYAIIGQDSVGLASIDDPTVVGWWMTPDEPDNAQPDDGGYGPPVSPATLITEYDAYKKADPTRPMFLGLGQGVAFSAWEGRGSDAPPESEYVPASDIVGFDVYPYNACAGDANQMMICGQFWLNALGVDNLREWSNRNQAVWTDFETTVINADTTAGPTPVETRSEVWLALIHAANGVLYFIDSWNPTFREDAIFEDASMVAAVTALNQEIKSLAPELNSASIPNLVGVTSSDTAAPIDSMVKVNGTTLYVFAAIARNGTATGSFEIEGMTGSAVATVVSEGRTLDVAGGKFSDAFAANGVHIYRIDLSKATCP
jgi:hypothetical protein